MPGWLSWVPCGQERGARRAHLAAAPAPAAAWSGKLLMEKTSELLLKITLPFPPGGIFSLAGARVIGPWRQRPGNSGHPGLPEAGASAHPGLLCN